MSIHQHKIGIILINYKDYAQRFLDDARNSLRTQTYQNMKVYIIDNDSTKETCAYLQEQYPEAITIPSSGNGWGHGNNVGMRVAWQDGCDAVVLANMDTAFEPNWLEQLVKTAYTETNIGIAQSKILLHDSKKINSVGNAQHFLGFSFCEDYNQPDNSSQDILPIQTASGAGMLVKKDVIDTIGYCDEQYFMYHDDMELSLRAKLAGFEIVLAPASVMYHKYEFNRSINSIYYMERNRHIFLATFYKLPTLILIAPAWIIMEIGMWLYALKGGWINTKWQVLVYFLSKKAWQHIKTQRKHIQQSRKITDRKLLENARGKIIFQEINNPVLQYIANPLLNVYWQLVKRLIIW